uniref:Transmembrane protein 106A n=1 Tax=Strix occidentalis caurina TaxID=311401 RepID=A0A8D0FFN9_STROC
MPRPWCSGEFPAGCRWIMTSQELGSSGLCCECRWTPAAVQCPAIQFTLSTCVLSVVSDLLPPLSEQEKQLVALIPYGDQRLKPRRTKLYVCLAVTTCLLTTSLSIFFLFPRSITVLPAGLNASSVGFNATTTSIYLNMTNVLNITNNNFYPVAVAQLDIEVLHQSLVVGKSTMKTLLNMSPLQNGQVSSAVCCIFS